MDRYEKSAAFIMKRGDAAIAERKRRKAVILRSTAALTFGTAAALGICISLNVMKTPRKPAPASSGIITETGTSAAAPSTAAVTTSVRTSTASTASTVTTQTTAAAAFTQEPSSAPKTTIPATSPATSEQTPETTTIISQGGINMKKISAFIAALTATGMLSPSFTYADASPDVHRVLFTQNEMNMFREYEEGDYSSDINGDGEFDICDVFELRLYGKRFMYCFDKYGHDQSKYAELSEQYSREAADRILRCYGSEGAFRFMPVSSGGTDPHDTTGATILARYYLFKNDSYPSDSEIFSALENRSFISSVDKTDIESFAEYIGKLRENIVYSDTYDDKKTYTDDELEAFARFDSSEVSADVNGDGIEDFFDGYDVLVYHVMKNDRGQSADENEFFSSEKWAQIEANGDVTLDGIVDDKDYRMLNSYFSRNTLTPSVTLDEMKEHLEKCIKEKEPTAERTEKALLAHIAESVTVIKGDPNIDGRVSIADSVAILQHIGNRDRFVLSEQGLVNADVDGIDGVTANDARVIQSWDAGA